MLLSAPIDVILPRIEKRPTNVYGKTPEDRALILRHIADVEPRLRVGCTHEIYTAQPLADAVDQLAEIGAG